MEIINVRIEERFKGYGILAEFNVYLCIYGGPIVVLCGG